MSDLNTTTPAAPAAQEQAASARKPFIVPSVQEMGGLQSITLLGGSIG